MKISILFLAGVVLLSWLFFLIPVVVAALSGTPVQSAGLFRLAGTFIPSLCGLLCTLKFRGREKLGSLLISVVRFRFSPGWFAFVFLFMPCIVALAALFVRCGGAEVPDLQYFDPPCGIVLAFFYIFALQGPLGEEFGWRGFALPGLLGSLRPLTAGLIVGGFWSVWHLPLFFFSEGTHSAIPFYGYAVFTTVMSLVYTVVWIQSGGDMFYPLVLHTVSNLAHGVCMLIGFPWGQKAFFFTFLMVSALFLIVFRKVLMKQPAAGV